MSAGQVQWTRVKRSSSYFLLPLQTVTGKPGGDSRRVTICNLFLSHTRCETTNDCVHFVSFCGAAFTLSCGGSVAVNSRKRARS
jgi:hypothetical protein